MFDKVKSVASGQSIVKYLSSTKWYRKIFDALLLALLLVVYGIVTGKVKIEHRIFSPSTHSLENTLKQSEGVQTILNEERKQNGYRVLAHYMLHNGTQSLDGYNFMKYSLTEYSVSMGVKLDPLLHQNVPTMMNDQMIQAIASGKCFTGYPEQHSSRYFIYEEMEVNKFMVCPVYSGLYLSGFVFVGVRDEELPKQMDLMTLANKISIYRKIIRK